ncbi:MAG: PepSY domain-containing protein [Oscillospiraceae bacterium]|nr:PepSY domain-containing protein [Oscillospiraceae bacterium]
MDKKEKFLIIFILVLIVIVGGFWYFNKKANEVSILQDFSKFATYSETKTISKEEVITAVTNALKLMDNSTFNASKHENELNNITDPTNFTIKESKKYELTMNLITGEILHYSNDSSPTFKTTKKTEVQVIKVADEMVAKLELPATYECTYAYPFDDELWGMTYEAKYGELYNVGQMIKFYFSPEEKRMYNFSSIGTKTIVANTEYKISKEDARKIADKLAKKNNLSIKRETSSIVTANYFWVDSKKSEDTNIYRLAYVFTCNDEYFTQIYVDAETGDIVGGSTTEYPNSGYMIPEPDKIIYYKDNKVKVEIDKNSASYEEIYDLVVGSVPERDFGGHEFLLEFDDKEFKDFISKYNYITFEYNTIQEINEYKKFNELAFPILIGTKEDKSFVLLLNGQPQGVFGGITLKQELVDKLDAM